MQKLLVTLFLAIKEARANFMHTMLSVLGIVIGVAALVIILSVMLGLFVFLFDASLPSPVALHLQVLFKPIVDHKLPGFLIS